jgi:3-oxoacyl-[acyl-carrier protein] reductase
MELGLENRIALVFGAGGGLGSAIARAIAAEGAITYVADINREAAEQTVECIVDAGGRASALVWDLNNLDLIEHHISTVEAQSGPVSILVNNTGGPPPCLVSDQSAETWSKCFQAMVLSVIAITNRVLPGMTKGKWGRIVTSTSSGVIAPIPNLGLSNALRLSLVGWSKTLSREVGGHGITCNVVVPGRIATQRITFLDEQKAKRENRTVHDVSNESAASISLGRYGKPDEYGDVVAFLASERASYITGSVIRIDGGLIASI